MSTMIRLEARNSKMMKWNKKMFTNLTGTKIRRLKKSYRIRFLMLSFFCFLLTFFFFYSWEDGFVAWIHSHKLQNHLLFFLLFYINMFIQNHNPNIPYTESICFFSVLMMMIHACCRLVPYRFQMKKKRNR